MTNITPPGTTQSPAIDPEPPPFPEPKITITFAEVGPFLEPDRNFVFMFTELAPSDDIVVIEDSS